MKCLFIFLALLALGLSVSTGTARADNLLAGVSGYTLSLEPNRGLTDTNHTKLTDGQKLWDFNSSLRWYLIGIPSNSVDVTLDMGSLSELNTFNTFWVRWEPNSPLPDKVEVFTSLDGQSFTSAGLQAVKISRDMTVCKMGLTLAKPVLARHVRFRAACARANAIISLCEVEALQPTPLGDLIIGFPYTYSGGTPNGTNKDAALRKLTDGIIRNDPAQSVQWNFATAPQDMNVQVTFELDRPTTLTRVVSHWLRDEAQGLVPPEIVNVYGFIEGQDYVLLGAMQNQTNLDKAVNQLVWEGTPRACTRLALVFNRDISGSGISSLAEIEAQGQPQPLEAHNDFSLAFVMSITAGSDVYFRPASDPQHVWQDPSASQYRQIVRALHDNYYANTLYIEYNGEVDRATALEYYKIWADACANDHVELVPVIGLVQWDYLRNINPAAEFGSNFYYVAPFIDARNAEARAYFRQFINDLLAQCPSIRRVSATDINQFSIARGLGYAPTFGDLKAWTDAILADIGPRRKALIFEQPGLAARPELAGIGDRLLDTYCYLLTETYGELRAYVAAEVANADHVEGDLVIVTDPGDRFTPAIERLAAQAIESAGGELSLDLIITAAVARDWKKESIWLDLLDDGYYQGFYDLPFEAVRQRFRLHHGVNPVPLDADAAARPTDWTRYE